MLVSLDESVVLVQAIADAAHRSNPNIIVLCHGGPISGPEEAEFIMTRTKGVHGFYGASSMERLPVEQAITNAVKQYKYLGLSDTNFGNNDANTASFRLVKPEPIGQPEVCSSAGVNVEKACEKVSSNLEHVPLLTKGFVAYKFCRFCCRCGAATYNTASSDINPTVTMSNDFLFADFRFDRKKFGADTASMLVVAYHPFSATQTDNALDATECLARETKLPTIQRISPKLQPEERIKDFSDVQSQIQRICGEITGSLNHNDVPAVDESDLSLKKFEEYQSELHELQKEKSDRLQKVFELVSTVHDLCAVLGMDFFSTVTKVHPSLNDSTGVQSKV
ncbi:hypothetical protein KIW84_062031 [Lathyrus oleraceus]|uniref:TIM-barrel domain-containing protein n=1 Tax=Pisum sativum TaxID=3888 RepID=A0A9D4W5U6_PEA|nr:hypothetical protein KIW84_062031 [Pisum sativum]